jgi:ElaB/YqjD/DUF883 family membrane-anchored ribosome-binding protein
MGDTRASDSFKSRAGVVGHSASDRFKNALAEKLHSAATSIEQRAAQSSSHSYGWQVAELLDRSADYVRTLDLDQIKDDIQDEVRGNPGRSIAIAAASGLLIGVLLVRR